MAAPPRSAEKPDDARRHQLLEAAQGVFLRYGFRKTSMDEVARVAEVSRQGLYLHFATKEELFRAAFQHALDSALRQATARLKDPSRSWEERLVGAFDELVGRYVGVMGAGASDLAEAGRTLVGPMLAEHEEAALEAVARAIRSSGLVAAYKPAGLTARQLADVLYATARGLKHSCVSREKFVEAFTLAARALCMPLRESR
ncbi:MAG: TetR/AcrR family transcriptional regulator [Myxococcota bacterium]